MKNSAIWLLVVPILVVAALYVAILRPDLLQPVARGLSGHYYVEQEGNSVIWCYDLAHGTQSVANTLRTSVENMTAWNVNYNNTRLVAAYCIGYNYYIRWYDIVDSQLVIDYKHPYTMAVPHFVTDISMSPDGKMCALIMNFDVTFQMDFIDLEKCKKSNIVLPSYRPNHQAPRWDNTGHKIIYVDVSKHMVMYDVVSKTSKQMADAGLDLSISPDSKLAYVYQYEDDPPYLRRLDDNSVVPLNNKESLVNWSPDSQGYDFNSLHIILYSLHYYDIKTGRSYRMPVPFKGTITRWVR